MSSNLKFSVLLHIQYICKQHNAVFRMVGMFHYRLVCSLKWSFPRWACRFCWFSKLLNVLLLCVSLLKFQRIYKNKKTQLLHNKPVQISSKCKNLPFSHPALSSPLSQEGLFSINQIIFIYIAPCKQFKCNSKGFYKWLTKCGMLKFNQKLVKLI